jgi:RND superfamily putative drug exporter
MGLAAAGTVTIAVLIAITLLPAILGFAGTRVARVQPRARLPPAAQRTPRESMGTRWARFVTSRPLPAMLVSLAVLGAVALPALHMKLGPARRRLQADLVDRAPRLRPAHRGLRPGFNGTLTVVVDAPNLSSQEQKDLANKLVDGLEKVPGVAAVTPAQQNEAGDLTIALVTPTTSPASDETKDLVKLLRSKADDIREQTGIQAYVTGTTP